MLVSGHQSALIRTLSPTSPHYPFVVVVLSLVMTMFIASVFVAYGVLFPFIQEDLHFSRAQLGLMSASLMVGGSVTSFVTGWLVDVMGVRRLQSLSMVGIVLGLVLFSQMSSFEQALVLALLTGVVTASEFPAFTKAIVDWVRPRSRALALGVTEAGVPVGGMGAALLLTFISVTLGWRAAVLTLTGVMGVCSVLFFIMYRDRPPIHTGREATHAPAGRMALVLKDGRIWLAASAAAALAAMMTVLVTYLVLFFKEALEMSSVAAGIGLAVAMAGGVVGRISWGLISDVLLGGNRIGVLVIIALLSGLSTALLTTLTTGTPLAFVFALAFFLGVTTMGWVGPVGILIAELAGPGLTGTAIGLMGAITRVGPMALAPLFGWTVDRTGSYDLGLWIIVGMSGVALLLLAVLGHRVRRA